jgi:hypothetical protein
VNLVLVYLRGFWNDSTLRVSRGVCILSGPVAAAPVVTPAPVTMDNEATVNMALSLVKSDSTVTTEVSLVPEKVAGYVPFGHFKDVRSIIARKFYPLYITGLSGNGKTMMVEQVCAAEKRECIRVNITIETDEDDLIGGFCLIDGKTVWQNGVQSLSQWSVVHFYCLTRLILVLTS